MTTTLASDAAPVEAPPAAVPDPAAAAAVPAVAVALAAAGRSGGAVEFERVVPPSGNLQVAGKQFWLGPARSGITVTFWADTDVIHLLAGGTRLKSVRSHLSVNDLAALLRAGGRPAGPPPLPVAPHGGPAAAVEVDRTVSTAGTVCLGQHIVPAAEILAGAASASGSTSRPWPSSTPTPGSCCVPAPTRPPPPRCYGCAGPGRPDHHPNRPLGQCRAAPCLQQRCSHGGRPKDRPRPRPRPHDLTIDVSETELAIHCDDGTRTVRRTTNQPVRSVKAHRPRRVHLTPAG